MHSVKLDLISGNQYVWAIDIDSKDKSLMWPGGHFSVWSTTFDPKDGAGAFITLCQSWAFSRYSWGNDQQEGKPYTAKDPYSEAKICVKSKRYREYRKQNRGEKETKTWEGSWEGCKFGCEMKEGKEEEGEEEETGEGG